MADDPTKYLMDLNKSVGMLDSNLDSTRRELEAFRHDYTEGRLAARDAAKELKAEISAIRADLEWKFDRRTSTQLAKFDWLLTNWPVVVVILLALIALGFITIGPGWERIINSKQGQRERPVVPDELTGKSRRKR